MVNGTRNVPNHLFENIAWNTLDQLKEKLQTIQTEENFDTLNRIDSKGKKLNQQYKKAAIKEIRKVFDEEIVNIANLVPQNSSIDAEEYKLEGNHLTKACVNKIVEDVHISLKKALDQLGMNSNVEKHINELVHRANFRFSDLDKWIKMCRRDLTKCI